MVNGATLLESQGAWLATSLKGRSVGSGIGLVFLSSYVISSPGPAGDGDTAVKGATLLESQGAWLATSLKGRSVGSGIGALPWDELLGTKLPPILPPSPDEPSVARSSAEGAVLAAQAALYARVAEADYEGVAVYIYII